MHPMEPEWMMASHLSDGCHNVAERKNCSLDVFLTTDLGRRWRPITSYVAQFDWAPSVDGVIRPGYSRESIFIVAYHEKHGNQPFGVWSSRADMVRSDDLWASHYTLLPRGNRFLFLDKFLFVAVVHKHHENQAPPIPAATQHRCAQCRSRRPCTAPCT